LAQWRWEFIENTYGKAPTPFVCARDGGRIIGTQAFIPIQMIDKVGVYWTAKSEATLIDFKYWGQHILEKMYEPLFHYAEEQDFTVIWGFTPAAKAYTQLPFEFPGKTEQLFLPFSSRMITSLVNKATGGSNSFLRAAAVRAGGSLVAALSSTRTALSSKKLPEGLEIRTMESADEQAGSVCERFVDQWGGATIYRDSRYLQWRLFENPYVRSVVKGIYEEDKLLGWVAFTIGDDGIGYLVDLLVACDTSRYTAGKLVGRLLLEAVLGARNMGATGIRSWRVNQHPFERLVASEAKKIGFYHVKRGYPVVLHNCPAGEKRPSTVSFDNWYVTRIYTEGALS